MTAASGVQITLTQNQHGTIASLTVNNPQRLNSLNTEVCAAFVSAVSEITKIPDLRCVIVTGGPCASGRAFVGGADISEMSTLATPKAAREFITGVHHVCRSLRDLPVPVVARVNGHALGAGLLVMAAADVRIAVSDALFGMPEVQRGVPSTVESALLPSIVGASRARRMLLLGDTISADEAERWGLVDKVVDMNDLDNAVTKWALLLSRAGRGALAAQKRLFNVWEQVSQQEAIDAGIWEFGRAFEQNSTESEGRSMMKAFLTQNKKRKAKL